MVAVNTSFFSEMLQSIADRSRALISRRTPARGRSDGIVELCEALLSGRGEASGVALANEILDDYADLTTGPRIAFFETLARTFLTPWIIATISPSSTGISSTCSRRGSIGDSSCCAASIGRRPP